MAGTLSVNGSLVAFGTLASLGSLPMHGPLSPYGLLTHPGALAVFGYPFILLVVAAMHVNVLNAEQLSPGFNR